MEELVFCLLYRVIYLLWNTICYFSFKEARLGFMQPIQLSGSNAIVSVSQGWYHPHLISGGKCCAWIIGSASIHLGKIIIHSSVHFEHHKHEEKITPTYNILIRWTRKKRVEKKQDIAEEFLSHPGFCP